MKITKILIVAFSLILFSCSKEENDVTGTSEAEFMLKSGGLTQTEVDQLKSDCFTFSTSSAFLNMRAKAKAFAEKLNYNGDPNLSYPSSRRDLESWLDVNLSITQFITVQEGLDMYDDLENLSGIFYTANDSFFKTLPRATGAQLQVILEPIEPELPPVETNSACDQDCVEQGLNYVDFAVSNYNNTVAFANGSDELIGIAESNLSSSIQFAAYLTTSCFEECDAQ
ncbi:hypothetical protein E0W68_04200 [Flavobacterium salilacus subsp. salilacus]|uniref:hypothetical protein n=1 Tax=Flavobacterium TaxID=237 RepID=UPI001074E7BF|nr:MULTISPECIES: hypothetical protein [Flavobacterium]KAF2519554.1 hypothetical protein E0W68_04200 [Flavobacterium salilacus subsp. salilacus]MBE1614547.1 hypothetical protein [Flavobacterium sp. SaA2.13]